MALPTTYRYTNLIAELPSGSFYEAYGTILPYRSIPTEIRLDTPNASTKYGLYLNEVYSGSVTSDSEGNVVFSTILPRGDVEITLLHLNTGKKISTWVTVRESALWLAGYAQVLEEIDADIERAYDSLFINQVHLEDADDAFGESINVYNNIGLNIGDYRRQLHELRLAYRNFGGTYRGLEYAVGEFTQVPPFGYARRKWGPNWVLDQSMLINHRFKKRGHTLSWSAAGIDGVELVAVEPSAASAAAYILRYNASSDVLRWSVAGVYGATVPAANGAIFVPGPPIVTTHAVLGSATSFTVNGGLNDELYLEIDNLGPINITLTTGLPAPTVANIVSDINTALGLDPRYGGYGAAASVYNTKVLIESQTTTGPVKVEHGADNAALAVFGSKWDAFTSIKEVITGVRIVGFPLLQDELGTSSIDLDMTVSPPTLAWAGPTGTMGAAVSIPSNGNYVLTDTVGNQVEVDCNTEVFPGSVTPTFDIGYQLETRLPLQEAGVWVVCDTSLLPSILTQDTVIIEDDITLGDVESPDDWFVDDHTAAIDTLLLPSRVIEGASTDLSPSPAFMWYLDSGSVSTVEITSKVNTTPMPRPGPRGSNFPQRGSGLFYDYEGFNATIGGWFRCLNASTTTVSLGFSFDGGSTWDMSTPAAIVNNDSSRYETPTFLSHSAIIPASTTDNGAMVKIIIDSTTVLSVDVDACTVQVDEISSSFLNDTTVSRNRQRQYFGELLWVWSPDALTLTEKEYIGLAHKRPSKITPFSGVTITDVSADTDAGQGTIEYQYNSVGDIRKLKWNSYTSAWSALAGWVQVITTGSNNLEAPDGSYITVDVTYPQLPNLNGTPPAAETSTSVTITDTSVEQGQARRISPAHSSLDIFDVTEYSSSGVPVNLKGVITEGDFSGSTMMNLTIQASNPYRYSFVYPTTGPVTRETLDVSAGTYKATLEYTSDEDQDNAILYIDGIPLFNIDPATGLWAWRFTSSTEIEMRVAYFSATSTYTLDYNLLYLVTTPVLDLETAYQDYAWWADYLLWDRLDANLGAYDAEVPLYFSALNGQSYLPRESTQDKSVAHLFAQDVREQREIAQENWRFFDAQTVEIDLSELTPNTQYFLQHQEARVYEESSLTLTFEHRSGISAVACGSASWAAIERNENVEVVNSHRYQQLRLTVSGIRDVLDFRIRSLVLKGLHLFGSGADVPGLTNV